MKILVGYDGRRLWNWIESELKPIRHALKWFLQPITFDILYVSLSHHKSLSNV
jgi:hypothetical protein